MILEKSLANNFKGRFREIISDPLNLVIDRVPNAGYVYDDHVMMHNGLLMPILGEYSYYKEFSDILILNRGVHEPLEEFCFQTLLKKIRFSSPKMLELGAYWGHYSSWMKHTIPNSLVTMVEPEKSNILAGQYNFENNNLEGEFIQDFVGKGFFSVDSFLKKQSINKLNVLHADIQGYEVEMLEGAVNSLRKGRIDYICISTHSEDLHDRVITFLKSMNYRIEVSSSFDTHTTSYDGFILASRIDIKPIFLSFIPMGRVEIYNSSPYQLSCYVSQLKKIL